MPWRCQLPARMQLAYTLMLDCCLPSRPHAMPWRCQLQPGNMAMQAVLAWPQLTYTPD